MSHQKKTILSELIHLYKYTVYDNATFLLPTVTLNCPSTHPQHLNLNLNCPKCPPPRVKPTSSPPQAEVSFAELTALFHLIAAPLHHHHRLAARGLDSFVVFEERFWVHCNCKWSIETANYCLCNNNNNKNNKNVTRVVFDYCAFQKMPFKKTNKQQKTDGISLF